MRILIFTAAHWTYDLLYWPPLPFRRDYFTIADLGDGASGKNGGVTGILARKWLRLSAGRNRNRTCRAFCRPGAVYDVDVRHAACCAKKYIDLIQPRLKRYIAMRFLWFFDMNIASILTTSSDLRYQYNECSRKILWKVKFPLYFDRRWRFKHWCCGNYGHISDIDMDDHGH